MKKDLIISIRNASSFDFGGGEKVPVQIAREINKCGKLKVLIFSRNQMLIDYANSESVDVKKSWWWSRQNWSGVRALLFPIYILWQLVLFVYYVVNFIKFRPITVHIQSKDDFIAGTFAARLLGVNVIWSDYADLKHVFLNNHICYKNPVGKMVYFAAHFCKTIITVSKEDRQLVLKNLNNTNIHNKFKVIHFGTFDKYIPTEKYNKFTFVYSGRLVVDKGVGELISAFEELSKKHRDIQLHILGDGPDREKFESLAKGIDGITFFGHQQNPFEKISKSHVFILPTYHEGFSIALVEATMLNLPIIATNVGGNPEIIHDNETGILVKIKDVLSLKNAMEKLFIDGELRTKLGDNARKQYLEKFQFDKIIRDEFIPLYEGKYENKD